LYPVQIFCTRYNFLYPVQIFVPSDSYPRKMTSENYVDILTTRKKKDSKTKGMVIGVEIMEKGDLSEKEIKHLMNITGASRNNAIKSLRQNTSPVDALMNLTGSK